MSDILLTIITIFCENFRFCCVNINIQQYSLFILLQMSQNIADNYVNITTPQYTMIPWYFIFQLP